MKTLGIIILMLGFNLAIGQSIEDKPIRMSNGDIKVVGVDPLGAQVQITYNSKKVKVYQERTLNGETTYAYFNNGEVTEYGTIIKPALVSSDIEEPIESDEP